MCVSVYISWISVKFPKEGFVSDLIFFFFKSISCLFASPDEVMKDTNT